MPKRINIHVVLRNEGWVVRKESDIRALSTHVTQREAIEAARKIARSKEGQLVIHRKNGRVRNRYRYNSDPLPTTSVLPVFFPVGVTEKAKRDLLATVRKIMNKSGGKAPTETQRQ